MGASQGKIKHQGKDAPQRPKPPPPTAAVIGAGMVGIHVAKELAERGFDVTVYERNADVGMGATRYDSGVVGAPFIPTGFDAEWGKDLLLGLFPYNYRPLITKENPWGVVFSTERARVAWARYNLLKRRKLSRERVVDAGNWLALQNEAVVHKMIKEIPKLQEAVTAGAGFNFVGNETWKPFHLQRTSSDVTVGQQLMLDPYKWTQILAQHIAEKHGVKYKLNHHVLRLNRSFQWGIEFVDGVVTVEKDVEGIENTKAKSKSHDITVICAGGRTIQVTWLGYPIPILPVASYGFAFPSDHPVLKQLKPQHATAGFGQLLDSGIMRSFRAGTSLASVLPSLNNGAEWWMVTGLTSLNTSPLQPNVRSSNSYVTALFRDRLRLNKGLYLDPISDNDEKVQCVRYVKDMTPDGLPVISRLGNFKNAFVCAGVGDDVCRLAAGAAQHVAQIIDHKAEDGRETPFSCFRFDQFYRPEDYKNPGENFVEQIDRAEYYIDSIGAPFWEAFNQWFKDQTVLQTILPASFYEMFSGVFESRRPDSWIF